MKYGMLIKTQFSVSLLTLALSGTAFADHYFGASCTSDGQTTSYLCVATEDKHDRWCAYGNSDCMHSASTDDCNSLYDGSTDEYENCMEALGIYDDETGNYIDNGLDQELCGKEDFVYGNDKENKSLGSDGKAIKLNPDICNYDGKHGDEDCIYVAGSDDAKYKSSCHMDYIGLLSLESQDSYKIYDCGNCHYQFTSEDDSIGVRKNHLHVKTYHTRYASKDTTTSEYFIPLSFNVTAGNAPDNADMNAIEKIWICPDNQCALEGSTTEWEVVWRGWDSDTEQPEVEDIDFKLSEDTQVTTEEISTSGAPGSTSDYMLTLYKVHSINNSGSKSDYDHTYDNKGYVKFYNRGTSDDPLWWAYAISIN